MSSKLSEVFVIREAEALELAPAQPGSSPGEVIKTSGYSQSFSLTNDEWKQWKTEPPERIRVVSKYGKLLGTLIGDQVKKAVSQAKFMMGQAKGISSDVSWWLAPIKPR